MDSTQAQEGQSHYDDVLMSAVIVCELWRVRMVSFVAIMSRDDVDVDLHIFYYFSASRWIRCKHKKASHAMMMHATNTVSLLMICELWSVRMVGNGSINEP